MRSVVLVLVANALGGFLRPVHTASFGPATTLALSSPSPVIGSIVCGNTGLAANAELSPLGLAIGLNSALNFANGAKYSSFSH